MFRQWRRRRAIERIEHGDGRNLPAFRWWQLLGRSLFHLERVDAEGSFVSYAIDARQWKTDENGYLKVSLYRNDRQYAVSRVPAVFPVEGGNIEVAASNFGLKRCHFVSADGTEELLRPDGRSAEGRRARLDEHRPRLSRAIGIISALVLLVGVALLLQEIAVPVLRIPPIAERIGPVDPLFTMPLWATIGIGVVTALASTERALRMRYRWWLDAAGN